MVDYSLASGAAIHDDGESVIALRTWPNTRWRLMEGKHREAVLNALSSPATTRPGGAEVLNELQEFGVLANAQLRAARSAQGPEPMPGLEIQLLIEGDLHVLVDGVRQLVQAMLRYPAMAAPPKVVAYVLKREYIAALPRLLGALQEILQGAVRNDDGLVFEAHMVECNDQDLDALVACADILPRFSAVFVDPTEVVGAEDRYESVQRAVEGLADMGVRAVVGVPTQLGPEVVDRALGWMELNEWSGIRVSHLVRRHWSGPTDIRSEGPDLEERLATLWKLEAALGTSALDGEPWRSVVQTALSAGRASCSSEPSTVFLAPGPTWARSIWHYQRFLHSDLWDLLPARGNPETGYSGLVDLEESSLPRCGSCCFLELCSGYIGSEEDSLIRSGDAKSAQKAIDFNCAVTTGVLESLMARLREEGEWGLGSAKKVLADFSGGTLTLGASAEGGAQ